MCNKIVNYWIFVSLTCVTIMLVPCKKQKPIGLKSVKHEINNAKTPRVLINVWYPCKYPEVKSIPQIPTPPTK